MSLELWHDSDVQKGLGILRRVFKKIPQQSHVGWEDWDMIGGAVKEGLEIERKRAPWIFHHWNVVRFKVQV